MGIEPALEQIRVQEPPIYFPFPKPWWGRILYGLFVTVIPAVSFWAIHLLKPEWQDGKTSSYVILSLFPETSLFFILLLIYSIASYLLLLFQPSYSSQYFILRMGVYTGVLLALQYSAIMLVYSTDFLPLLLILMWILPYAILWSYRWGEKRWAVWKIIMAISTIIVMMFIALSLYYSPFIPVAGILIASPFWSFLIAFQAALWLFKNYETKFTLRRGLGAATWIVTYAFAWRYDILKMYELYAQLPKQPPDCYIATAAAKGHPRVVGARQIHTTNGIVMRVNQQLQILKCFELAVLAISPLLHKAFRNVYDVVGKYLARKIQNPFLADMAYLCLKPSEWLARLMLRVVIPEIDVVAEQIYKS